MITIVLPTKNRSTLLRRQLAYYSQVGFHGTVLIGDSSHTVHLGHNKKWIKAFDGKLDIVHIEYPESNVHHCVQQLVGLVNSPYAVYVSDDDFLIPSSMDKCRRFLDKHPEYCAVHGVSVKIKTIDSSPHGRIVSCKRKQQPIEEANSGSQRFLHYFNSFSDVYYSIHRTDSFRAMYERVHLFQDARFSDELLPNCLSIINGKIKQLDCLSLVRHVQDNPTRTAEMLDTIRWITGEDWLHQYEEFREILSRALRSKDGIAIEEAQRIVNRGFSFYLVARLQAENRRAAIELEAASDLKLEDEFIFGGRIRNSLGVLRQRVQWLSRALLTLRARMSWSEGSRSEFSLNALLDSRSPYHEDFLPIYRAITMPPVDL